MSFGINDADGTLVEITARLNKANVAELPADQELGLLA